MTLTEKPTSPAYNMAIAGNNASTSLACQAKMCGILRRGPRRRGCIKQWSEHSGGIAAEKLCDASVHLSLGIIPNRIIGGTTPENQRAGDLFDSDLYYLGCLVVHQHIWKIVKSVEGCRDCDWGWECNHKLNVGWWVGLVRGILLHSVGVGKFFLSFPDCCLHQHPPLSIDKRQFALRCLLFQPADDGRDILFAPLNPLNVHVFSSCVARTVRSWLDSNFSKEFLQLCANARLRDWFYPTVSNSDLLKYRHMVRHYAPSPSSGFGNPRIKNMFDGSGLSVCQSPEL